MKLIHTSDLHIGISLFGLDMLPFQKTLAAALKDCAKKHKADCIIISGDIYDSAMVPGEAVKCWDSFCRELFSGEEKTPVIVISGNHDSAPRLSVNSSLLEMSGLYIRGSFRDCQKAIPVGDTDIYCIPYFNLSEAKEFYPDKDIKTCTDAFLAMTEQINSTRDKNRRAVIAAHCFAAGGNISESERASKVAYGSVGGAQQVSSDVFAGFDYAALGHLHRAQTISCPSDSSTVVRYSGTPIPYSFSEAEHKKTFTIFDTLSHELTEEPVPESIKLITLKDSYDRIMSAETPEDAYVFIVLTDRSSAAGLYDRIEEKFPNMLGLKCEMKNFAVGESESAEKIAELSLKELAAKYLSEMFGRELTEEQAQWLAAAEESCSDISQ